MEGLIFHLISFHGPHIFIPLMPGPIPCTEVGTGLVMFCWTL